MAREVETPVLDALGDADVPIPYRYSITAYGADYPVDALVKRLKAGSIYKPHFQRAYVWTLRQASRFVESLLLGLPVPGVFLAQESASPKLLVLDGLQRLRTLQYFIEGVFPQNERRFRLHGVQKEFEGRAYNDLAEDDRIRFNDFVIHATIVRQDDPSDDQSSIYYLFERINTGGTQLAAQEIRSSLYHGKFIELLAKLNENDKWRDIFGPPSKRMRDQELILRFFGLLYYRKEYARPMRLFLNKAVAGNRKLQKYSEDNLTIIFSKTIGAIHGALGSNAFRPKTTFNAAVFDSVMVGLATRLARGPLRPDAIRSRYKTLLGDEAYYLAVTKSTADEEVVKARLSRALAAFE